MEEKTGFIDGEIFLQRGNISLASWCYSLMPYLVALETALARIVLGWQDVPFWLVWSLVFVLERPLELVLVYLRHVYGYRRVSEWTTSDWVSLALAVLAVLVAALNVWYSDVQLHWYWRLQVIGFFVTDMILLCWVGRRVFWDLAGWAQIRETYSNEMTFLEYVQQVETASKKLETAEETAQEVIEEVKTPEHSVRYDMLRALRGEDDTDGE